MQTLEREGGVGKGLIARSRKFDSDSLVFSYSVMTRVDGRVCV